MITMDFITALFYEVDEQLGAIPKHPEAHRRSLTAKNFAFSPGKPVLHFEAVIGSAAR